MQTQSDDSQGIERWVQVMWEGRALGRPTQIGLTARSNVDHLCSTVHARFPQFSDISAAELIVSSWEGAPLDRRDALLTNIPTTCDRPLYIRAPSAVEKVLQLMEVSSDRNFEAYEFVKEESCLLMDFTNELPPQYDRLLTAAQQDLPGRDVQMAKVREGAEAVAGNVGTDARCEVTVLSRGPGSGKSTTMVYIADNWKHITERTSGERGPIVCQWTYNSRMNSPISQKIWPGVTGEQAAVARCLHGTLSCMGCQPIAWVKFLRKLEDEQNRKELPKSLPAAVDLMIDLFGEGRDVLIMVDELMLAATSNECYFPDGQLQNTSDPTTTPSPGVQDYMQLAELCCAPMEACRRKDKVVVFTLLSALTFDPTRFRALSPRPVTEALLTPLNFSAAFKYGTAYCPGVPAGIIGLVCGLTNGHPRLLNKLLDGLKNHRRTPTGPQEYKAALDQIGEIYKSGNVAVSNQQTQREGSDMILLSPNQVFEYAFEQGGFTKQADVWDAQEVVRSTFLRQLVQNGQVSLVPDASAKDQYRVDLIPLAIIYSLGSANPLDMNSAFPRVRLLWQRLYEDRAASSDAWQAFFDGSDTVQGSRPGPQLAERMWQFFMASALADRARGDQVRVAIFPGLDTELHWSDPEVPSLFDYFGGTLTMNDDLERGLRANGHDLGIKFDTGRSSFERFSLPDPASGETSASNTWDALWMHVKEETLRDLRPQPFWKAHFVLPPDCFPGIDTLIIFYRKNDQGVDQRVFMGAQQKAWRSELDDSPPRSMGDRFEQLKDTGGLSKLGGTEYPWREIDGEVVKLSRVWLHVAGAEDADIPDDMKAGGNACTVQEVPLTVIGATALRNHFVPALASLASCGTGTGDRSQELIRLNGIGKATARALNDADILGIDELAALTTDRQDQVWRQLNAKDRSLNRDRFCSLVNNAVAFGEEQRQVALREAATRAATAARAAWAAQLASERAALDLDEAAGGDKTES